MIFSLAFAAALLGAAPARAQEPGAAPVPIEVKAIAGCWRGEGQVMGKPVAITLTAGPAAEDALFIVDSASQATGDPADRHAAHLIFGGKTATPAGGTIFGFWSDSFGGDYTAIGSGAATPGGFEVSYAYPDARFINRWSVAGDRLSWRIVAADAEGVEADFADYALTRADCPAH
ncbi:MAG: hypothetical protein ACK4UQ_01075 [Brevundimonas sp.]